MTNPLKVCIVTGGQLPIPDVMGGAAEHLITLLLNQNEAHKLFDFTILCLNTDRAIAYQNEYKHTKFITFKHERTKLERTYREFLKLTLRKIFHRPFYNIRKYEKAVERYLLEHHNDFDLIINETAEPPILYRASKRFGNAKHIWHIHSHKISNPLYDMCYSGTLCVSNFVKNEFTKNSIIKSERNIVLYNALDSIEFHKEIISVQIKQFKLDLGYNEDDIIILFCGRIVDIKGVRELTDAVLSFNNKKVKLLIVGSSNFADGKETPYSAYISKQIESHPERLKMTGYVNHNEISKYHQVANIAIVPSICEEAFPLTLCEYMMSGLPTIATKSGGMLEAGDVQTTLFIDKDRNLTQNIISAIKYLLDNPEIMKKMGEQAKIVSQKFDAKHYLHDFYDCIKNF